jgi:hypothetical protein
VLFGPHSHDRQSHQGPSPRQRGYPRSGSRPNSDQTPRGARGSRRLIPR